MELLTSAKTTYLLEAGLDILHEQSNDWLNEIAFYREEIAFYYTIIIKKTHASVPVHSEDVLNMIEKQLDTLSGGTLDKLEGEVQMHERALYMFLQNKVGTEREYRDAHKKLAHDFDGFENNIKGVKRDIFSLIKLINQNKEE
jgi:hypothetical protein